MRGTIVRIGATCAGALLTLGLFGALPAGADGSGGTTGGSDTACFTATGQTQGRSHSDPDGMSNGGADKPGCPGGFDADKDGNNGCGNDADREDDNNGNCGRKGAKNKNVAGTAPTSTSTTTTTASAINVTVAPNVEPTDCQVDAKEAEGCTHTAAMAAAGATAAGGTSASGTPADTAATSAGADNAAAAQAGTMVGASQTEVLGQTLERPSALVRTGAGIAGMVLLGGLLCGSGRLSVLARQLLRIG